MIYTMEPTLLIIVAIAVGLLIGSFLNVVIYRYPLMLHMAWRRECQQFLGLPVETESSVFNFFRPRSHCPHCSEKLTHWHTMPLMGFLLLRGRCGHCHKPITYRYPLVEILSAAITVIVFMKLGLTLPALAALLLSYGLLTLGAIDLNTQLLPDGLTLGLLWLGLLVNSFYFFTSPENAIYAAIIGYVSLWIFARGYHVLRGREGMGHGDFKLFSALGAWLGVSSLLNVIIVASFLGLLMQMGLIILRKTNSRNLFAFGPYLVISGWLTFVYGNFITNLFYR